jgi:hypothetical protein
MFNKIYAYLALEDCEDDKFGYQTLSHKTQQKMECWPWLLVLAHKVRAAVVVELWQHWALLPGQILVHALSMLKSANMGTCHYRQCPGSGKGKWAIIILLPIYPNYQNTTSLKYVQKKCDIHVNDHSWRSTIFLTKPFYRCLQVRDDYS